jgi:hypothetical protein
MPDTPPTDPADHAEDFARRWFDRLENAVEGRMHALDVPEERIGSSDHDNSVAWRTFFPHERDGGGVATGGRITVDSGVLNPDLLTRDYGKKAGRLWARSRLRDRVDAIIVHELAEGDASTHEEALALAPGTALPITKESRRILRAMEKGWKR